MQQLINRYSLWQDKFGMSFNPNLRVHEKLQKSRVVTIQRVKILLSLVSSCRHTGKERQRGKDRSRERLIRFQRNPTMGSSGLNPAAALISLVCRAQITHFGYSWSCHCAGFSGQFATGICQCTAQFETTVWISREHTVLWRIISWCMTLLVMWQLVSPF